MLSWNEQSICKTSSTLLQNDLSEHNGKSCTITNCLEKYLWKHKLTKSEHTKFLLELLNCHLSCHKENNTNACTNQQRVQSSLNGLPHPHSILAIHALKTKHHLVQVEYSWLHSWKPETSMQICHIYCN